MKRCMELEELDYPQRANMRLWGLPFTVKDNIDVAGMPTSAGCTAFTYTAQTSAACVQSMIDHGGILLGKTVMDQFACGLVGTRCPTTPPTNPVDARFIPGGSSSGSAVSVAGGLCSFSLGTDTAGSGRVPAMCCGIVGVKPTPGALSTKGVVPAKASVDCVSVFAQNVRDGALVRECLAESADPSLDATLYPSPAPPKPLPQLRGGGGSDVKVGVPGEAWLDFSSPGGDVVAQGFLGCYTTAQKHVKGLGASIETFDYEPFAAAAKLLYEGAFVAERYAGLRTFLEAEGKDTNDPLKRQALVGSDERLLPVIRSIFAMSAKYTAVDLYSDMDALRDLRGAILATMSKVHVLLLPTAPAMYTVEEVQAQEGADPPSWAFNANLGRFTNFVNLMGFAALALPAGYVHVDGTMQTGSQRPEVAARLAAFKADGGVKYKVPFGVTLVGPGGSDEWLAKFGARLEAALRSSF